MWAGEVSGAGEGAEEDEAEAPDVRGASGRDDLGYRLEDVLRRLEGVGVLCEEELARCEDGVLRDEDLRLLVRCPRKS